MQFSRDDLFNVGALGLRYGRLIVADQRFYCSGPCRVMRQVLPQGFDSYHRQPCQLDRSHLRRGLQEGRCL